MSTIGFTTSGSKNTTDNTDRSSTHDTNTRSLSPQNVNQSSQNLTKRSTDDRDKSIGLQIRTRRTILGLSQQELSKQLGISFQQLQKYEKGANRTTATRLIDIARILNCSIELLITPVADGAFQGDTNTLLADPNQMGSTYSASSIEDRGEGPRNRELLELNRYFMRIPNKIARRQLINLVRSMALMADDRAAPDEFSGTRTTP